MRIIVCVKLVNKELSPFDACALEYALRFKDSDPDTDLTIICMGRPVAYPPFKLSQDWGYRAQYYCQIISLPVRIL